MSGGPNTFFRMKVFQIRTLELIFSEQPPQ